MHHVCCLLGLALLRSLPGYTQDQTPCQAHDTLKPHVHEIHSASRLVASAPSVQLTSMHSCPSDTDQLTQRRMPWQSSSSRIHHTGSLTSIPCCACWASCNTALATNTLTC
jgi:hypothetical protein